MLTIGSSYVPVLAQAAPAKRFGTSFPYTTNHPEVAYGVPLVQVRFDGNINATFAIDTGASSCFISDALAKKMALNPKKFGPMGRPYLLNGKPVQSVSVAHLSISDLHIKDQTLLIIDDKTLSFMLQCPVDGVIGMDLLKGFTMLFDCPHHHIAVWYPGGFSPDDINGSAFKNVQPVPLKFVSATGLFSVPVELQNSGATSTVDLTLDTGAGFTSIQGQSARQLSLMSVQKYGSTSVSGAVEMSKAYVSELRLGASLFKDQQVVYPSQEETKFPYGLGMDILSSRFVLMDFPQKKMYVLAP